MTFPSNDNKTDAGSGGGAGVGKDIGEVGAKTDPCPICKKPPVKTYEPFCSKRCADVDLHRWLSGGYGIPAREEDDSAGEEG